PISDVQHLSVPGLSSGLLDVERRHWFFVSDLAAFIRGLTTQVSLLSIIAVVLFGLTFSVLWRTPFGLRVRSCGEAPYAAESLGVKVLTHKYAAVIISGAMAGLGGAFLGVRSGAGSGGPTRGGGGLVRGCGCVLDT